MNPIQQRNFLRYLHIAIAVLIAGYLYSPSLQTNAAYAMLVQYGAFPLVAVSGLVMWQQSRIRKWVGGTGARSAK
jgi:hypothetical protein